MGSNKLRRKSKSAAVYIPIAILLIIVLVTLGISVFLKIVEIEVIGASLYTKEEIITASGIMTGDNMLLINADDVSRRIYSAMPYIDEVNIKLSPPDLVSINVTETRAMAAINYPGGAFMIDSTCRVLEKAEIARESLIEIRGFIPVDVAVGDMLKANPGDDTRLKYLKEVLDAIGQEGIYKDVLFIDVASIANINFLYGGRFTVIIGTPDNMRYKLSSLKDIITDIKTRSSGDETWTIYMTDREPWRWAPDR